MKPIYSDDDKYKIVTHFILIRGKGDAPITDFSPLLRYLDDKSIKHLHEIKATGCTEVPDLNRAAAYSKTGFNFPTGAQTKTVFLHTTKDAEEYFNWLIWIVSADETATEETRKEAVNQLFLFIFVLRDNMHISLDTLLKVSFVWEDRINAFDRELIELKGKVDNIEYHNDHEHDELKDDLDCETKKIADLLEKIGNWQKDFQPRLEKLEKIQKNADKIFKGKPNAPKRNN